MINLWSILSKIAVEKSMNYYSFTYFINSHHSSLYKRGYRDWNGITFFINLI